jgi:hypothetical protein
MAYLTWANYTRVRFGAFRGLKPDIEPCPSFARSSHSPLLGKRVVQAGEIRVLSRHEAINEPGLAEYGVTAG